MTRIGPEIKVKKLSSRAALPVYASTGAAGMDVSACLETSLTIEPREQAKIPTGLAVEIPAGFEIQVRPRSGLAAKNGVTVLNAPGTIDADYRGEICILLVNLGRESWTVSHGDRVAQLVVAAVSRAAITETDTLSESPRGGGGFGSTGL